MHIGFLTTRKAAQALGVSEASLKRWCDQGLIPSIRTPGGHRRLPLGGFIQFIRRRRYELVEPRLLGLPEFARHNRKLGARPHDAVQAALRDGDPDELHRLVLGPYLAGQSAAILLDDLVTPAFHGIGDEWAHGDVAIYEERRAIEICTGLLHHLRTLLPAPAPDAPRAIGGTLVGDPYALPTTMVALALREVGWAAQSYGCGHPADTLIEALRDVRPRLFWLSVSAYDSKAQFIADCNRIYAVADDLNIAVLLGGRVLTPDIRQQVHYSAYCDALQDAVAFAKALHPPPSLRVFNEENAG